MINVGGKSVVYFILGRESIKVGTTRNLRSRFQNLQTASGDTLKLLGAIPGAVDRERELHAKLAQFRRQGEWFSDCEEVRSVIREALGRDVFAGEAEAIPSPSKQWTRLEICEGHLEYSFTRLTDYGAFCLRDEWLLALPIVKRNLVIAAFKYAHECFKKCREEFSWLKGRDEEAAAESGARGASFVEQLECHVELILGVDDASFLDGWVRLDRINPLFETKDGRLVWRSKQEAIDGGWQRVPIGEDRLIMKAA